MKNSAFPKEKLDNNLCNYLLFADSILLLAEQATVLVHQEAVGEVADHCQQPLEAVEAHSILASKVEVELRFLMALVVAEDLLEEEAEVVLHSSLVVEEEVVLQSFLVVEVAVVVLRTCPVKEVEVVLEPRS